MYLQDVSRPKLFGDFEADCKILNHQPRGEVIGSLNAKPSKKSAKKKYMSYAQNLPVFLTSTYVGHCFIEGAH